MARERRTPSRSSPRRTTTLTCASAARSRQPQTPKRQARRGRRDRRRRAPPSQAQAAPMRRGRSCSRSRRRRRGSRPKRSTLGRTRQPPAPASVAGRSPIELKVEKGYETALGAALGDDLDASSDASAPLHWSGPTASERATPPCPAARRRCSTLSPAPAALAAPARPDRRGRAGRRRAPAARS